jgi:hypothetical protein
MATSVDPLLVLIEEGHAERAGIDRRLLMMFMIAEKDMPLAESGRL